jgi:hypothetical protein
VHFSARYSRDASELGREARELFERTLIGKDGMEVEVEYPSEDTSARTIASDPVVPGTTTHPAGLAE